MNSKIFGKSLRILENSQVLGKFSGLGKIFMFSENSQRWLGMLVGRPFFSQIMSLHHSDQMSQWSQVSRIARCMSKVKVSE